MALIEIADASRADELIGFFRERGCVAVIRGATKVQAVPSVTGGDAHDDETVRDIVVEWTALHPGAPAAILDE